MKVTAAELLQTAQKRGHRTDSSETDAVTAADQRQLVDFLRQDRQAKARKITLTRKETTTVKQADGQHTVKVEVRRKRVLVKNYGSSSRTAREQAMAAERARALRGSQGSRWLCSKGLKKKSAKKSWKLNVSKTRTWTSASRTGPLPRSKPAAKAAGRGRGRCRSRGSASRRPRLPLDRGSGSAQRQWQWLQSLKSRNRLLSIAARAVMHKNRLIPAAHKPNDNRSQTMNKAKFQAERVKSLRATSCRTKGSTAGFV